jgi:hypothetical protein
MSLQDSPSWSHGSVEAGTDSMEPLTRQVTLGTEPDLVRDEESRETVKQTFLTHVRQLTSTILLHAHRDAQTARKGSAFLSSLDTLQLDESGLAIATTDPYGQTALPMATLDAASLLRELRGTIQDGNGQWSSGGTFWWGDLGSTTLEPGAGYSGESYDIHRARNPSTAFAHAAMALACELTVSMSESVGIDAERDKHLQQAGKLLGSSVLCLPLRTPMADISAFSLLGCLMLETNRINAAYLYVGLGLRLCMSKGLHQGGDNVGESEKRTFWTLYTLDRWLSCLLGRPLSIADDVIQVALPSPNP